MTITKWNFSCYCWQKKLGKKILTDNFFPLILASPLQPPTPSSSLNRKFLSSKQGRVKHQLRDVLSLQMPLCISLQASCPSSGGFFVWASRPLWGWHSALSPGPALWTAWETWSLTLNPESELWSRFAFLCSSRASLSRRKGTEKPWLQLSCQVSYFGAISNTQLTMAGVRSTSLWLGLYRLQPSQIQTILSFFLIVP